MHEWSKKQIASSIQHRIFNLHHLPIQSWLNDVQLLDFLDSNESDSLQASGTWTNAGITTYAGFET